MATSGATTLSFTVAPQKPMDYITETMFMFYMVYGVRFQKGFFSTENAALKYLTNEINNQSCFYTYTWAWLRFTTVPTNLNRLQTGRIDMDQVDSTLMTRITKKCEIFKYKTLNSQTFEE